MDENLHSIAGAGLFNILVREREYSSYELKILHDQIYEIVDCAVEHETQISKMIFEKGPIDNITYDQLVSFGYNRANICLQQLNMTPKYKPKDTVIADYFYTGINNYQYNDFFSGIGREYQRDWDEESFIWKV